MATLPELREALLFFACSTVHPRGLDIFLDCVSPPQIASILPRLLQQADPSLQPLVNTVLRASCAAPAVVHHLARVFDCTWLSQPSLVAAVLTLPEASTLVCLCTSNPDMPQPAVPVQWRMTDLEFVRPEGLLVRVPSSITVASLCETLFGTARPATAGTRSIRVDMNVLLIAGRPISIGAQVIFIRNESPPISATLLCLTERDVWLACPDGPTGVEVVSLTLASLQSGDAVLMVKEQTCRASLAKQAADYTLGELPLSGSVLDLDCDLASGMHALLAHSLSPYSSIFIPFLAQVMFLTL